MTDRPAPHHQIPYLRNQVLKGEIFRRDFLRYATLLGLSMGAALAMIGLPLPGAASVSVKRGGTFRVASPVQKVTHPAQFSWIAPSQRLRQVAEYLTLTDENNITHPYLLHDWQASNDLKTWTLNLRKGITFNNGDPFTSDDVVFTFNPWRSDTCSGSWEATDTPPERWACPCAGSPRRKVFRNGGQNSRTVG